MNKNNRKIKQELICCICLASFDVSNLNNKLELPHRLPLCSHQFHKTCIEQWLKTSKTCPYCRKDYSTALKHTKQSDLITHDHTVTQLLQEIASLKKSNITNEDYEEEEDIEEEEDQEIQNYINNSNSNNSCGYGQQVVEVFEEKNFTEKTLDFIKENPIMSGLAAGALMFAALITVDRTVKVINKNDENNNKKE